MSNEDQIKEAFNRAKTDIAELREYIYSLYYEIEDIKHLLEDLKQHKEAIQQTDQQGKTTVKLNDDLVAVLKEHKQRILEDTGKNLSLSDVIIILID